MSKNGTRRLTTCFRKKEKNAKINPQNNERAKRLRKDPNDKKFGTGGQYEETRKQRRAEEAEERDLAAAARANPALDQSEQAVVNIILEALDEITEMADALRREFGLDPHHPVGVNVYGASTGSKGFSIVEEGRNSSLCESYAGLGYRRKGTKKLRALSPNDRKNLGPDGRGLYNCHKNDKFSSVVEKRLQIAVRRVAAVHRLQPLWRVEGRGCPQGLPDYWVCARVFLLNANNTPRGKGVVWHKDIKLTRL